MAEKVQGEGDYESGREYQEKTKKFVKDGRVDEAARKAKKAVEDEEESEELERAEDEGKSKADYDDV